VTIDTNCFTVRDKHMVVRALEKFHEDKKIRLHTPEHMNDQEKLKKLDMKLYHQIKEICFPGIAHSEINVNDHTNLCLLTEHAKSKGHFFVTLEPDKFIRHGKQEQLEKLKIKVRMPDMEFFEELDTMRLMKK
jgi:hypothetical protein